MKLSDLKTSNEFITPVHPEKGVLEGIKFELHSPFGREYNAKAARISYPEDENATDRELWLIYQANAVIAGWSGVDEEYSEEECSKMLEDPKQGWLVTFITDHLCKKKGYLATITQRLNDSQESMDT